MVTQYIGAEIRRQEDPRLLSGQGVFVDDVNLPHMLHAAILRSPHAHARIRSIDASKACAVAGVAAVFEFKNFEPIARPIPARIYALPGLDRYLQFPLARDKVRYVGDPVAVVVAETPYLAEDALEEIEVAYEPLPAVVNVRDALRDEVLVHEQNGSNLASHYTVSVGDVDEAFRVADYTRREEFKTQRLTGSPLETRGILASYNPAQDELTVWGPTKVAHYNRGLLSTLLNFPEHKIHFIEPDVGGGFGVRGEFYPEDFLIPYASMQLNGLKIGANTCSVPTTRGKFSAMSRLPRREKAHSWGCALRSSATWEPISAPTAASCRRISPTCCRPRIALLIMNARFISS